MSARIDTAGLSNTVNILGCTGRLMNISTRCSFFIRYAFHQ